ncbi:probable F420-dependent oxidoreductase, Rv2161c family [Sphingomonas laterariae]|uniref:Probable F420-dependent oxidoreductase, Rv2161c family n=1 Tax=Edaphosphingomonas laterariae TaxID=861865 RepID=A0A239I9D0_9SPHN|nr:TIGR03619 family F420-dependent LLM class oxidoreductase [Sphingomonas laterariae]SNS89663.1 probable F420-dependent oxidoreductase, Rv2161c family [Sphingomonas laterariae]
MGDVRVSLGLIGLETLFGGDVRAMIDWLAVAEDLGIDGVTLTDHVVMGEALENYPYGPFPMPLDWPWWEPIALLSAIAQATKRVRLQTAILISPLRPAVLLAKQLATLDVISGGRVSIGLGVGWQKEEYEASGVPWEGRFGLMVEQIEVCRALWRDAPAAYHGKTVSFDRIHSRPFPVQGDRIPIMLGIAPSDRNVARIADHADGWLPIQADVPSIAEGIVKLRAAFVERGRDPKSLMVRAVPRAVKGADGRLDVDRTLDNAHAMVEAGVTEIELFPLHFTKDRAGAEALATKLATFKASLRR